jgi:ABC-2 type transport system permease protein
MTLLAVERLKLFSTRSPWWCAATAWVVSIGFAALIAGTREDAEFVVALLALLIGEAGAFGSWFVATVLQPRADLALDSGADWINVTGVRRALRALAAVIAVAVGVLLRHDRVAAGLHARSSEAGLFFANLLRLVVGDADEVILVDHPGQPALNVVRRMHVGLAAGGHAGPGPPSP